MGYSNQVHIYTNPEGSWKGEVIDVSNEEIGRQLARIMSAFDSKHILAVGVECHPKMECVGLFLQQEEIKEKVDEIFQAIVNNRKRY